MSDHAHDDASAPLDERLLRVADLHTRGLLDPQEFAEAKRMILTTPAPGMSTLQPASVGPRRVGRLPWWAVLLIAIFLGFVAACLAAAVTALQRPAGWALCSDGRFVAGNVVQQSVSGTGYNLRAVCVASDGITRSISSARLLGVLWLEYAAAAAVLIALVLVITRATRVTASSTPPAASLR